MKWFGCFPVLWNSYIADERKIRLYLKTELVYKIYLFYFYLKIHFIRFYAYCGLVHNHILICKFECKYYQNILIISYLQYLDTSFVFVLLNFSNSFSSTTEIFFQTVAEVCLILKIFITFQICESFKCILILSLIFCHSQSLSILNSTVNRYLIHI